MRWKGICEYDGGFFSGWQIQSQGELTVQGAIESRLLEIFGKAIRVHGSSRTDTGVHAMAQVFHFDADWKHGPDKLLKALRIQLPTGLHIKTIEEVPRKFHACSSATGKEYAYYIHEEYTDIFERQYCWSLGGVKLDIDCMKLASDYLIGRHDFTGFGANNKMVARPEDPIKTMEKIEIDRDLSGKIIITMRASGYLYKMARSIVGGLVEVGTRKLQPIDFRYILESRIRTHIIPTAPAHGLRLVKVFYDKRQFEV